MGSTDDVERLDVRLASLAREEGALRLRLGQLLEVLGRGAVFDLGFSSLGAYAVERCERSVRWVEAARCLARRVEALPALRRALAAGHVSWTMAEVLARVATPGDEARWLAFAQSRTVRQVQRHVDAVLAAATAPATVRSVAHAPAPDGFPSAAASGGFEREGREPPPTAGGAAAAASNVSARDAAARGARDSEPTEREAAAASDVSARGAAPRDAGAGHAANAELGHWASGDEELCTLTYTVDREDAWLYEATRCLLDLLGDRDGAAQSEALLAEAQGTLLMSLPPDGIDGGDLHGEEEAQRRWVEQLRRWRVEAEVACEKNILAELSSARAAALSAEMSPWAVTASLGIATLEHSTCAMLDRQVRSVSGALARHELDLSQLVLRFHRADGWSRLGYATEGQYALERLGLSRSSLAARRALALRLERLPGVAAALGAAQIGVEAALQLVRVATPNTEAAWIERASRRTIKHLREEVAAARVAVRLAGVTDCPPPEDLELAAFQVLEQTVVSGRFGEAQRPDGGQEAVGTAPAIRAGRPLVEPASGPRRAWSIMLASLGSWLAGGLQMPAAAQRFAAASGAGFSRACSLAGRVTLRLRMSRETRAWWRHLEARARRWLPPGTSWLRFLCLSLWQSWHHLLGTEVAYGHIYIRDRFRCASPVCNRRDVTPHHIQFRSAGGSDEDHNITSACTWCHLHGVHGGRIRATGTADHVRWELGPRSAPTVIVDGRERMAA